MSTVTVYSFEDENGEPDDYTTQDYHEAYERAVCYGLKIIANTYEWSDSEVVDDFTWTKNDAPSDDSPEYQRFSRAMGV